MSIKAHLEGLTYEELKELKSSGMRFITPQEIQKRGVDAVLEEIVSEAKENGDELSEEDIKDIRSTLSQLVELQEQIDKGECKLFEEMTECKKLLQLQKRMHESIKIMNMWKRTSIIINLIKLGFILFIIWGIVFKNLIFTLINFILYVAYLSFMDFIANWARKNGKNEFNRLNEWIKENNPEMWNELQKSIK